ncbi:MAG: hypothetical protein WAK17_28615 [Candidatus Nitrosopolaris sp.]
MIGTDALHADNFLYSFGSELQSLREGRPGRLRLVKLHGSPSLTLKEKDGDQCKEKSSPHTSDFSNENDGPSKEDSQLSNFLASKLDDFWRIYDELETEQAHSPESTMCIDSVDAANVSIDSSGICTQ